MTKARAQGIEVMKNKVIQSALDLAAQMRWDEITMTQIARHAGVSQSEMRSLFIDKVDILAAHGRQVDLKVKESLGGQSLDGDLPRDRLFDVLMERFDVLNENRGAILSILDSVTLHPKQSIFSLPWLYHSMDEMMILAGIKSDGWRGALRVVGLVGVYMTVLYAWTRDDSEDMAATMASLDSALNRADQLAEYAKI